MVMASGANAAPSTSSSTWILTNTSNCISGPVMSRTIRPPGFQAGALPLSYRTEFWWFRWDSNSRPLGLHASALPDWATEPRGKPTRSFHPIDLMRFYLTLYRYSNAFLTKIQYLRRHPWWWQKCFRPLHHLLYNYQQVYQTQQRYAHVSDWLSWIVPCRYHPLKRRCSCTEQR